MYNDTTLSTYRRLSTNQRGASQRARQHHNLVLFYAAFHSLSASLCCISLSSDITTKLLFRAPLSRIMMLKPRWGTLLAIATTSDKNRSQKPPHAFQSPIFWPSRDNITINSHVKYQEIILKTRRDMLLRRMSVGKLAIVTTSNKNGHQTASSLFWSPIFWPSRDNITINSHVKYQEIILKTRWDMLLRRMSVGKLAIATTSDKNGHQ
jgi:hypothetical protein